MEPIVDPVIGSLQFAHHCWNRSFQVRSFGKDVEVPLRVENEQIDETDRATFAAFVREIEKIIPDVEAAVDGYYRANFASADGAPASVTSLGELVSLHHSAILYSRPGVRNVGFVFDADFDPELGVGVLVVNEAVVRTSVQDIVL